MSMSNCTFKQLLLNPRTQERKAIDGVDWIANLITRYRVIEITYKGEEFGCSNHEEEQIVRDLKRTFETRVIEMYSKILEFQICIAYHYSRGWMSRTLREVVITDDWEAMIKDISGLETNASEDRRALDSRTLRKGISQISSQQVAQFTQHNADRRNEIRSALSSSLDYESAKNATDQIEKGECGSD